VAVRVAEGARGRSLGRSDDAEAASFLERMPADRRPRNRANGRVSGATRSIASSPCTAWASGAPSCGVPSEIVWVTRAVHAPPRAQALRATSPPIEWPTRAIRSTGQSSPSISAPSSAPLSAIARPVL